MKKFFKEFKEFALRGNVMDMAVGIIIGGAFSGIVTSLTDNFINPIINLIMGNASYTKFTTDAKKAEPNPMTSAFV